MRAHEFITEHNGKIGTRRQAATVGLDTFGDAEKANSDYTLNRVMMAVACADGSTKPIDMDAQSWIGKKRSAHPYTKVEQNMLKQAFKAAGAEYKDLNDGNMNSEEHPAVNIASPVVSFKGYPR